ncbi:hypothetical protein [Parasulfitobacter algicola]|uniref:Lipoprotein n=1 Tax=Parasulfitobacter algicola TaxID=2614809 RepID=A0ABX2IUM8_9RHOB|nr:hypothetical protein [Sulfitobacter algicola]NSX56611.1 hypothetical protein [Sulfitobacter algicola]
MKTGLLSIVSLLATALIATSVHACSLVVDERALPGLQDYLSNKPVQQDAVCAVQNGGVEDWLRLGPAQDVGNGRVFQTYGSETAIVTDCKNNEFIHLFGKVNELQSTTCGAYLELSIYLPPKGSFDLAHGATLQEFASYAQAEGMGIDRPTAEHLYNSPRRRDRFDIFCGCKIFYPDSAGAAK